MRGTSTSVTLTDSRTTFTSNIGDNAAVYCRREVARGEVARMEAWSSGVSDNVVLITCISDGRARRDRASASTASKFEIVPSKTSDD